MIQFCKREDLEFFFFLRFADASKDQSVLLSVSRKQYNDLLSVQNSRRKYNK